MEFNQKDKEWILEARRDLKKCPLSLFNNV